MYMIKLNLRRAVAAFVNGTRGAVTVDWVVLTAALVAMAIGVFVIINKTVVTDVAVRIADDITLASN